MIATPYQVARRLILDVIIEGKRLDLDKVERRIRAAYLAGLLGPPLLPVRQVTDRLAWKREEEARNFARNVVETVKAALLYAAPMADDDAGKLT